MPGLPDNCCVVHRENELEIHSIKAGRESKTKNKKM